MSTWITTNEIAKELQSFWPELVNIWPNDKRCWCPTYFELRDSLREVEWYRMVARGALETRGIIIHTEYVEGVRDSDICALELQADISRYRMLMERNHSVEPKITSWAFGTVICSKVANVDGAYTLNICKTSDKGYILIEPKDNSMWDMDKEKDILSFIEIR